MKTDYIGMLDCRESKSNLDPKRSDAHIFATSWFITRRELIKLKILKWLIPAMILSFLLGYQYDHDMRLIKLQHEIDNQKQLINKQQDYIKNVVAPVKRIMFRNHCHDQVIYSSIMKTPHPKWTARIIEIESEFYQFAVSS
jgi:hypothetical protein